MGCTLYGISTYKLEMAKSADSMRHSCLLIEYEAVDCEYSCSESNDYIMCSDTTYQYVATIESKCDNQTLIGFDECPGTNKTMGEEYTCYVQECDDEFAFTHSGNSPWKGMLAIVIGIIGIVGMPCIFMYHGIKDCIFEMKHGYKP